MLKKMKTSVMASFGTIIFLLALGTVFFHLVERWGWIDAFYFSVVTLTTVGYGDLAPTSEFARLFTAIYLLVGAGAVLASLGVIGSRYLEVRSEKLSARREEREKRQENKE